MDTRGIDKNQNGVFRWKVAVLKMFYGDRDFVHNLCTVGHPGRCGYCLCSDEHTGNATQEQ